MHDKVRLENISEKMLENKRLNEMGKFCVNCGTELNENQICDRCKSVSIGTAENNYSDEVKSLAKGEVCNVLVWINAFIPIIGAFFAFGFVAFFIVNSILAYFDEKNLQKAGYDTSNFGSTWIVPVYLYKRAKYFSHSMAYFAVWCVAFALSCF